MSVVGNKIQTFKRYFSLKMTWMYERIWVLSVSLECCFLFYNIGHTPVGQHRETGSPPHVGNVCKVGAGGDTSRVWRPAPDHGKVAPDLAGGLHGVGPAIGYLVLVGAGEVDWASYGAKASGVQKIFTLFTFPLLLFLPLVPLASIDTISGTEPSSLGSLAKWANWTS